jgi:hypothetical protein
MQKRKPPEVAQQIVEKPGEITDESMPRVDSPEAAAAVRARRAVNARMRAVSGEVDDHRALVAFLYELMRDELTPGRVESLVDRLNLEASGYLFTNGWLASHAQDLADRLTEGSSS